MSPHVHYIEVKLVPPKTPTARHRVLLFITLRSSWDVSVLSSTLPRSRTRRLQALPPASSPRPCSLMQMPPKPRHQIKPTRSTSCARLPLGSFRPPPGSGRCHAGTGAETLDELQYHHCAHLQGTIRAVVRDEISWPPIDGVDGGCT